MEPVTQNLNGFLLTFEKKEFERINRRLVARGYHEGSDGLKKLILDIVEQEEGPEFRIGGMIGKFIENNPAAVAAGVSRVVQSVGKAIKAGKRK